MNLKKVSTIVAAAVMAVTLFVGCGAAKGETVSLNLKANDAYIAKMGVKLNVEQDGNIVDVEMELDQDLLYTEVSKDKIVSESVLKDMKMKMKMGAMEINLDKNNPQFKDIFGEIIGLKTLITTDGKGELIDSEVKEGNADALESTGMDLEQLTSSMNKMMLAFVGVELSEGKEIEENVGDVLKGTGQGAGPGTGDMLKDVKAKAKVESIKDGIATIVCKVENFKTKKDGQELDVSLDMTNKVNMKTGITEKNDIKLSMSMTDEATKEVQNMVTEIKLDVTKK